MFIAVNLQFYHVCRFPRIQNDRDVPCRVDSDPLCNSTNPSSYSIVSLLDALMSTSTTILARYVLCIVFSTTVVCIIYVSWHHFMSSNFRSLHIINQSKLYANKLTKSLFGVIVCYNNNNSKTIFMVLSSWQTTASSFDESTMATGGCCSKTKPDDC